MELQPLLIRLLIGALIIWLFEKLIAIIPTSTQAKELINIVMIIVVVLWAIFGFVVIH